MRSIEDQLILHEGLRLKPYRCTAGKLTIGVGRNLEDKGISHDEAMILLRNDIAEVTAQLEQFDWFRALGPVRRKVLIDMCFNLGMAGLLGFQKMIEALNGLTTRQLRTKWYTAGGIDKWAKEGDGWNG